MKNNFSYFKNEDCQFFPCHQKEGDFFNCLFCYCPLYALGSECGGNFKYIAGDVKDCSDCTLPHSEEGYAYIVAKYEEVKDLAAKNK